MMSESACEHNGDLATLAVHALMHALAPDPVPLTSGFERVPTQLLVALEAGQGRLV